MKSKTIRIKPCEQGQQVLNPQPLNKFSVNKDVDSLLATCAQHLMTHLSTSYSPQNYECIHKILTAWSKDVVQWAVFGYRGHFQDGVKMNYDALRRLWRSEQMTSLGLSCGVATVAGVMVAKGWTPDIDMMDFVKSNPVSTGLYDCRQERSDVPVVIPPGVLVPVTGVFDSAV